MNGEAIKPKRNTTLIYVRRSTVDKFRRLAKADDRSIVSIMDVAADEALKSRGLDKRKKRGAA